MPSEDEVFGVWNPATGTWTKEPALDYAAFGVLAEVQAAAKSGAYERASAGAVAEVTADVTRNAGSAHASRRGGEVAGRASADRPTPMSSRRPRIAIRFSDALGRRARPAWSVRARTVRGPAPTD
ncbi:hypothetical protein ACFQ2K_11620 [Streptomyces sanglieri]|uniref:Uncharacterized protein n=1 Tax=Streptomyces sanglieri TaxID=193460 RepID=A0ABW2WP69_9ACTN